MPLRRVAAFALTAFVVGCISSTPYGKCVGLNGGKSSSLRYEYSARNISVGILFIGLVIPPVVVALNELECPVGPAASARDDRQGAR